MATPATLAGPVFLGGSAANVFTPTSGIYVVVKLIHLCNTDTLPHQVTVYAGSSGGGSGQQIAAALNVPANGIFQIPLYLELASNQYIAGFADTGSEVTITVMGDQNVYPH